MYSLGTIVSLLLDLLPCLGITSPDNALYQGRYIVSRRGRDKKKVVKKGLKLLKCMKIDSRAELGKFFVGK